MTRLLADRDKETVQGCIGVAQHSSAPYSRRWPHKENNERKSLNFAWAAVCGAGAAQVVSGYLASLGKRLTAFGLFSAVSDCGF